MSPQAGRYWREVSLCLDLPHRVIDAAVESRQPVAAEWRGSEGAGVNPLIHYGSDLCPFIYSSFRR